MAHPAHPALNLDNRLSVDLVAITHNLRGLLPASTHVAGVVKADAYGHASYTRGARP